MTDAPQAKAESPHLPGLDGIRGLAILLVMFSHFIVVGENHGDGTHPFHRLLLSGYLGVDLFFVLSGFLITGILVDARSRPHYFRTFYMRRALRIFPLYYGLLAVAYLSVPLLSPEDAPLLTGADSPWWYWLYASNIGMAVKGNWLTSPTWFSLGHFWSLAVEEQFYMVWPFVVFLTKTRWLYRLCAVLVLSSPFVMAWLHFEIGQLGTYVSTLGRVGSLAAGGSCRSRWCPACCCCWTGPSCRCFRSRSPSSRWSAPPPASAWPRNAGRAGWRRCFSSRRSSVGWGNTATASTFTITRSSRCGSPFSGTG
jgi:peptidoglycan/LPS O-acetylase OafA/YrhL